MKRLLSILLSITLLSLCGVPALGAPPFFEDVVPDSWYEEAVVYTCETGLFKGITETQFGPFVEISRAMFVTVLGRFTGVEENRDAKTAFSDVTAGSYYVGYVKWASDAGIVNGVGGDRFAPNKSISRQDMCVMLRRYCNYMGIELTETAEEIKFTDEATIRPYALESVRALQRAGIVNGMGSDFKPLGTSNRAQAAAVMMRIAKLAENQKDAMRLLDQNSGIVIDYTVGCGITAATALEVTVNTEIFSIELSDANLYTITFKEAGEQITPNTPVTVKIPVGDGADARNRTVYILDGNVMVKADYKIENGYYTLTTDCSKPIVSGIFCWTENY